ncbi:MAG: hypoxanthine phosphoribosyltransferase [Ruminococcus sp.]|nr:hypoxanthine phosphoribosyltransferase [Ruminococcus sp.]
MNTTDYRSHIGRIIITQEEINARISEVGKQLSAEYSGKPLLLISVLNGAFVFMADLCRSLTIPCEIGFMCAKSYCGTESTGSVEITMDVSQDISKFHVIIVEDIIDTGRTLSVLSRMLRDRQPLSFKIITLLDKPSRRVVDLKPDIALFTIPDLFIIGYGLDFNGCYRNLPYISEYIQ